MPLEPTFLCRQVVRHLESKGWKADSDLQTFVRECTSNFLYTFNEEGFGSARRLEKDENKAHRMSHVDFWSILSFDGVLETAKYREVESNPMDKEEVPEELPASLFHTRRRSPSCPELRHIVQRQTWTSISPMHFCALPAEHALMCSSFQNGTMEKMPAVWRTALLVSGLVCRRKGDPKNVWYVSCGVWPGGNAALLLPLRKTLVGKLAFWAIENLSVDGLRWAHVHSFQEWEALPTEIVSPLSVFIRTKGQECKLAGPFLECDKAQSLLRYAASCGFWDLSRDTVQKVLEAARWHAAWGMKIVSV
eukprot:s5254_g1.t1